TTLSRLPQGKTAFISSRRWQLQTNIGLPRLPCPSRRVTLARETSASTDYHSSRLIKRATNGMPDIE
ncbi:MAG: hypothetical protein VW806_11580, partial [Halieaceae bacterium]